MQDTRRFVPGKPAHLFAILNVYCAKLALNFVRLELQGGAPLR